MIPHNERSARVEKLYLRLLIPRDEHGDIQLYKIGSFQRLPRGFLADPSKLDPQINYLVWSLLLQKVFAPAVSGGRGYASTRNNGDQCSLPSYFRHLP